MANEEIEGLKVGETYKVLYDHPAYPNLGVTKPTGDMKISIRRIYTFKIFGCIVSIKGWNLISRKDRKKLRKSWS